MEQEKYFDSEMIKRQRRNLVLMSAWMGLFLLGGVGFPDKAPTMVSPIFPFAIKNKLVIEGAMWLLFGYFWWRYYQYSHIHLNLFSNNVTSALISNKRIISIIRQQYDNGDFSADRISGINSSIFHRSVSFTVHDGYGGVAGYSYIDIPFRYLPVFLYTELKHQIITALKSKTFSEFLFPHVFAVTVITVGLQKYISI